MLIFKRRYDGGENSNVTGYWLIEIKNLFSIVLLKFEPSHRENFHSHAFNALTFWVTAWALCFRGPWKDTWVEYNKESDEYITLTHGRRVLIG